MAKKSIVTLITVVMMLFCAGTAVYGDTAPDAITMGPGVLADSVNTEKAQTVYYGSYIDGVSAEAAVYPWRVIGYGDEEGSAVKSEGEVTFLAAYNLGHSYFSPGKKNNEYATSDLKKTVDKIAGDILPQERAAIIKKTLLPGGYNWDETDCVAGSAVKDALLWPLSTKEANAVDKKLRMINPDNYSTDEYEESWWLRSPGDESGKAAYVYNTGSVCTQGGIVDGGESIYGRIAYFGVRPAFGLPFNAIVFTSAAVNGKDSLDYVCSSGKLAEVSTNTTGEWKFTLLDDGTVDSSLNGHKDFTVDVNKAEYDYDKKTVTVPFRNAVDSSEEWVSAIITDSDGRSRYYGRVAYTAQEQDGSVTISTKDMVKGDRLYVFNEKINGDKTENSVALTDYSSALFQVPVPSVIWSGSGSSDDPFVISGADSWSDLAEYVEAGFDTQGKYFRLDKDIEVSTMIGTDSNPFRGVFDGDGHAVNVSIEDSAAAAPFRRIKGADSAEDTGKTAVIKNLIVKGTISGGQHSAGLVVSADGYCNISCCVVDADITAPGNLGGIIGHGGKSNLKLDMCVFSGSLTGAGESPAEAGGLWGWSDTGAKPTVRNSLEMGRKYTNVKLNPIGRGVPNQGDDLTVENCFYVSPPIGDPTWRNWEKYGSQVYKVTADKEITVGLEKTFIDENKLIGISVYSGGISYSGAMYTEKGTVVDITVPSVCDDCKAAPDTVKLEGKRPDYKIKMPSENVAVTYEEGAHHDWEFSGFSWTGNEEDGYTAAVAEYTCGNDSSHKKSVSKVTLTSKVIEQTCTAGGKTVYTASVAAADSLDGAEHSEDKDGKATAAAGHKWKFISFTWIGNEKDGYKRAVASYVCDRDENHKTTVKADMDIVVTEPTCTSGGKTTYTASLTKDESPDGAEHSESKDAKATSALGHKWAFSGFTWTGDPETGYTAASAGYTCINDSSHKETCEAAITSTVTEPTCTAGGKTTFTAQASASTSLDGREHSEQKDGLETAALGHSWEFAGFIWTGDADTGYTGATALYKCRNNAAHGQNVDAEITSRVKAPTCTQEGRTTYIAVVKAEASPDGQEHHGTNETLIVEPTGHDWGDWETVLTPTCVSQGLEMRTCKNDPSHQEFQLLPIDQNAHDWEDWTFVTEPETDKAGTMNRVCRRDSSHVETSEFAASSKVVAKMTSSGKTSLNITWSAAPDAEGYEIWLVKCAHKSKSNLCQKIATVAAGGSLKYTKKSLKKQTAYKAFVAAYKTVDGEKVYIDTSLTVHCYTSGGDKKYTNPKKVTTKKSTYTLAAGKTAKIKATVTGRDAKKKLIPTSHCAKVRYLTTDPAVATVSTKGKITAVAAGTCKINVLAANGVKKTVKVTVK